MKYILTALFTSISLLSLAQQPAPAEKSQNIYFYRNDRVEVSTKDSADIIQIVTEPEIGSKLYAVQEFYKDGSLRMLAQSVEIHPVMLQGQAVYYYPDRTKQLVAQYIIGKPTGESYEYYPNGKKHIIMNYGFRDSIDKNNNKVLFPDSLFKYEYDTAGRATVENGNGHFIRSAVGSNVITEEGDVKNGHSNGEWKGQYLPLNLSYIEVYNDGRLVKGSSIDNSGKKYNYKQRIKVANYLPYLRTMIIAVISANMNGSLRGQGTLVQRHVNIGINISADGTPGNYTVLQSVNKDVDAEALRRVKLASKWAPAEYYGRKVPSYYVFPFLFIEPK